MANNKGKTTKKNEKNVKYVKKDKKPQKVDEKAERFEKTDTAYRPSAILPYFLILVSVILAICFVTLKIFEIEDGAGIVGRYLVPSLSGLVGSAMYLLPAMLFYIGIKKLVFSLRWFSSAKKKPTAEHNPASDRKHVALVVAMSLVCVLLVSVFFGVISYEDNLSVAELWQESFDATEGVVGGIVGGGIAMLFVMCFEKIISIVLLSFAIAATFLSAVGLTPRRIVAMIQDRREARLELLAREEEEALRLEEEEQKDGQKQLKFKAVKTEIKPKENIVVELSSADDAGEEEQTEEKVEYKPLDTPVFSSSSQSTNGVYIGINGNIETIKNSDKTDVDVENVDFGGDPTFDNKEYKNAQGILDTLRPSEPTSPQEEKKPEPHNEETEEAVKDETKDAKSFELNEIEKDEFLSEYSEVEPEKGDGEIELVTPYVFPPIELLIENPGLKNEDFSAELSENAQNLLRTLDSFKVRIDDITYSRGPTITRYELKPSAGTRVRTIANLVDDIALSLATTGVRIEAPIPNKPAVGVEVPNRTRETVYLSDLVNSQKFFESKSRLTACLGMDVGGNPIYFDVAKMPHLLIAGATGMGKSVCINTIIISLLYKARPDELKLILIDPKKVEFTMYKHIPHLYAPIVTDPKKAAGALASAVAEMERRFEVIETAGVKDISGYNATLENYPDREFMPHMVIIIDELADLMMTAPDDVESSICRLAQKARAAGIHIIIGTQRPSVDVITGLIKANIPSRIACTVASQTDSRTILDMAGAEKLIGKGDMLFAPVGASKPMRVQGAFVSEGEVEDIVTFIRDNNAAGKYNAEFIQMIDEKAANVNNGKKGAQGGMAEMDVGGDDGEDPKFNEAVIIAIQEGKVATSFLQRKLGVGYGKAAKMIDAMEDKGYVSKADGNKPRRVLITMDEYMRRKNASSDYDGD